MPSLAFLLAAAATSAAPQPAELKVFQDWTVGCDNGRACHAVALVPENWPDDALTMSVRRGPERAAMPVISFELGEDAGAVSLAADGKALPARLVAGDLGIRVAPADNDAVLAALRSAGRLDVRTADGRSLGTVSLKGATAALLFMDDMQDRDGTASALVSRGDRKPTALLADAPPLPIVVAAPPPRPGTAGPALGARRLAVLRKQAGCEIGEVGGPETHEIHPIDPHHSLLLLACGSGAYNISYVPYVLRRRGGQVSSEIARFDVSPEWWEERGRPVLINAGWDAERRRLGSFSKGRGLGDCGTSSSYAWDGTRFRLAEQAEMGECRGSLDYITTWRADVR